jgi:hypothetical protein
MRYLVARGDVPFEQYGTAEHAAKAARLLAYLHPGEGFWVAVDVYGRAHDKLPAVVPLFRCSPNQGVPNGSTEKARDA